MDRAVARGIEERDWLALTRRCCIELLLFLENWWLAERRLELVTVAVAHDELVTNKMWFLFLALEH
jgi:hypothetical protein